VNLYVACGLTHVPRDLFTTYVKYIHALARGLSTVRSVGEVKYALVNSDPQLADKPWSDRATLCYAWDRQMVEAADLVVADASFPSTGLGIELQIAEAAGIPVVMLIGDYGINRVAPVRYENPDHTAHDLQVGEGIVTLMALGLPAVSKMIEYVDTQTAIMAAVGAVDLFVRD
jgi:hypothetical protein